MHMDIILKFAYGRINSHTRIASLSLHMYDHHVTFVMCWIDIAM